MSLRKKSNSLKNVRWSAVPVPEYIVVEAGEGSRAVAPNGTMTYAFTLVGNFLFLGSGPEGDDVL